MPIRTDDPRRRAEIAKIKIGQKQLGLDDAVYRSIVKRVSAKFRGWEDAVDSCALMEPRERRAMLDELSRLGFKAAPARAAKAPRELTDSAIVRKIRACWLDLRDLGALDDASERALRRFVENQTNISDPRFLTAEQANIVIEALKGWHNRVRKGGIAAPSP